MRIASLLPSATEILFALDLGPQVIAVTHECDYPREATRLPKLTGNALPTETASSAEIDAAVRGQLHLGASIYHLDEHELARLEPDLVLTQELCPVCAVSYTEVLRAVRVMDVGPKVLSLEPHSLDDILATIREVAAAARIPERGMQVAASLSKRIEAVRAKTARARKPRMLCLEWIDPPIVGGHWVPEMVEIAGGVDVLGSRQESKRVSWDEVIASRPDVIVLMPCGFDASRAFQEYRRARLPQGWEILSAVQSGRVYAGDASAYFARPGPRIVDGLEILASILHPELFAKVLITEATIQITPAGERPDRTGSENRPLK